MSVRPLKFTDGSSEGLRLKEIGGGTITRLPSPLEPDPVIKHAVNAQIPVLPEPLLLLHGPLLATVETWSDNTVVARLPFLALYAQGDSDTLALDALISEIVDFATGVSRLLARGDKIGGPLEQQWKALNAMVDLSALGIQ